MKFLVDTILNVKHKKQFESLFRKFNTVNSEVLRNIEIGVYRGQKEMENKYVANLSIIHYTA